MRNVRKRAKGEPREIYLRRRIAEEQAKVKAVLANPFQAASANGLMAHEIRALYQEWEESIAERSRADRQMRENMRKDDL